MFKENKKTLERRHSGVFIVNFEQISHIALMGTTKIPAGSVCCLKWT